MALSLSGFGFLSLGEAEDAGRSNKHESPRGTVREGEREVEGSAGSWETGYFGFVTRRKRLFTWRRQSISGNNLSTPSAL
jgi:hypothetical protein